jgi:outer membrane biosynthesis protein TonB
VARSLPIDLEEGRRREFRRFFVVSTLLHVGMVGLFVYSPSFGVTEAPMGAISVNLVAAAPARSAPAPRPKPAPAPKAEPVPAPVPKPKPPVPEKRVLPKETTAPKPTPRQKREEIAPEDVVRPETKQQEYTDVLDQLRSELGEEEAAPAAEPEQVAAVAPAGGGGTGRPVSPEVADWMRRVRIHVRRSWVVPPGFRQQSLVTSLNLELDAGGNLLGEPEILTRSGNPWYDDGVVRSIRKASPLPAPPEAGVWPFAFDSAESY